MLDGLWGEGRERGRCGLCAGLASPSRRQTVNEFRTLPNFTPGLQNSRNTSAQQTADQQKNEQHAQSKEENERDAARGGKEKEGRYAEVVRLGNVDEKKSVTEKVEKSARVQKWRQAELQTRRFRPAPLDCRRRMLESYGEERSD